MRGRFSRGDRQTHRGLRGVPIEVDWPSRRQVRARGFLGKLQDDLAVHRSVEFEGKNAVFPLDRMQFRGRVDNPVLGVENPGVLTQPGGGQRPMHWKPQRIARGQRHGGQLQVLACRRIERPQFSRTRAGGGAIHPQQRPTLAARDLKRAGLSWQIAPLGRSGEKAAPLPDQRTVPAQQARARGLDALHRNRARLERGSERVFNAGPQQRHAGLGERPMDFGSRLGIQGGDHRHVRGGRQGIRSAFPNRDRSAPRGGVPLQQRSGLRRRRTHPGLQLEALQQVQERRRVLPRIAGTGRRRNRKRHVPDTDVLEPHQFALPQRTREPPEGKLHRLDDARFAPQRERGGGDRHQAEQQPPEPGPGLGTHQNRAL